MIKLQKYGHEIARIKSENISVQLEGTEGGVTCDGSDEDGGRCIFKGDFTLFGAF